MRGNPTLIQKLLEKRLLIVTGKGGVGKSTLASALASEAASRGQRALLVGYEASETVHPVFGTTLHYLPEEVAPGLYLARIDARDVLKEYVHRSVPFGMLYDWFLDSTALAHFTEAAPGFEELMCLGKIYDHVEGPERFDLVVFDAPATGHASLMLRVPRVTAEAVATGPVHHNALKVQLMLESTRTDIVVAALPEEMALREAAELSGYVQESLDLTVGALIINRITPQRFTDEEIHALAELDGSPGLQRIVAAATVAHERATMQAEYEAQLASNENRLHAEHVVQQVFDGPALAARIGAQLAGRAE